MNFSNTKFVDSRHLFICADIPADSEDLRDCGHHRAVPVAGQRGSLQVREQAHLPPGLFSSVSDQNAWQKIIVDSNVFVFGPTF